MKKTACGPDGNYFAGKYYRKVPPEFLADAPQGPAAVEVGREVESAALVPQAERAVKIASEPKPKRPARKIKAKKVSGEE